jgi:hypothetical protein
LHSGECDGVISAPPEDRIVPVNPKAEKAGTNAADEGSLELPSP